MRQTLQSRRGQLLLPILALLFLFGIFLAGFLKWCQRIYWQMRMDMVAEAVALSAARAQAEMLNDLAILQTEQNAFLQEVAFGDVNVGHVQNAYLGEFKLSNIALTSFLRGFNGQTMAVAQGVARANRIQAPALPDQKPDHHLEPQKVRVIYFAGIVPDSEEMVDRAFFLRKWGAGKLNAQPDHKISWGVCDHGSVGTATAAIWLDVAPGNWLSNGGFPGKDLSWERGIGIQCFFPQFNARLVSTSSTKDLALKNAFQAISR